MRLSIFHLVFLIPCWLDSAMLLLDPEHSCFEKKAPREWLIRGNESHTQDTAFNEGGQRG